MTRRAKLADKIILRDNTGAPIGVQILFTDGRKVETEVNALPKNILMELITHGLSQKLGDSYSSAKGDVNFAFAECSSVLESLLAGDWNRRGSGTGVGGDLAQAIANLTGQALDVVQLKLMEMDDEVKEELKKRKDVKAEVARIKAERAERQVSEEDTETLIGMF